MAERLSDTALLNLDAYLDARTRGALSVEARQALRGALAELRAHRAQALTAIERALLRDLWSMVRRNHPGSYGEALAVLDKLLAAGGAR